MTDLSKLLSERDSQLRNQTRTAIEDLRAELAAFGAAKEDLDTLRQAALDLESLFLLVVVGEFNAGKSALINSLLGAPLLEEGVTPTTTSINLLHYGEAGAERWLSRHVLEREYNAPILRDVAVVDTPGTNAVLREHQVLTEQFVPRSDLVLFVTSADRPFTESERAFLEAIRSWGKKVVLVINKIDLLRNERELEQVTGFVGEKVSQLLGFQPHIFPVSARRAREATGSSDPHFLRLQRFIGGTLTAENRVKLKLSSPLGVAGRVLEKYRVVAADRLNILAEDAKAGESILSQLDSYRGDMRAQFAPRIHEVENIVYEMEQRADRFFDETFRLGRVIDLVNADKVRADFQQDVVANTAERIESSVDTVAQWMVDRESLLWRGVADELSRRRQARQGEIILGEIGGNFEASRQEMIQNVARTARAVVSQFDREAEAKALGHTMREAVAQTALAGAGAVGLGTLVTALGGALVADVTGILAGTFLAGLGLYIIPMRKQRAQKQFRAKAEDLRVKLREALSLQLTKELESSLDRIQTAISPYLRFVKSEREKVSRFHDQLTELDKQIGALRRGIGDPSFGG